MLVATGATKTESECAYTDWYIVILIASQMVVRLISIDTNVGLSALQKWWSSGIQTISLWWNPFKHGSNILVSLHGRRVYPLMSLWSRQNGSTREGSQETWVCLKMWHRYDSYDLLVSREKWKPVWWILKLPVFETSPHANLYSILSISFHICVCSSKVTWLCQLLLYVK